MGRSGKTRFPAVWVLKVTVFLEVVFCIYGGLYKIQPASTVSFNDAMILGEYTHTLDAKKRVSLPSKFRKEIGKKIVITHGLDNCLFVYSIKQWEKISQKLTDLSLGQADTRGLNRFFLAGAIETDVDSIGRILIPDYLKDFAKLSSKVVVIGVHDRIEIWNEKQWKIYKAQIEKKVDGLAEKLGEIGAI